MAPKIPKSFGLVKTDKKGKDQKGEGARLKGNVPKVPILNQSLILKRKDIVDLTEYLSKKQRTEGASSQFTTLALNQLGPLASVFIKDEEVKEWERMSLEEATKASIKASAQLMYHSMHSIDRLVAERARLTQLEGSNSMLKRQLKENDTKWQKDLQAKEADLNFFKKEVKDQEEMLNSLNDKFKSQDAELVKLRARLEYLEDQKNKGWADEKKEIQDDYFARGFNFYLIGFMANDPDYTFEKFGEETVAEMAEFRRESASLIKERRIELGLDNPEGAPTDYEDEQMTKDTPENIQKVNIAEIPDQIPPKSQVLEHGASSDGASVTPSQLISEKPLSPAKQNQGAP